MSVHPGPETDGISRRRLLAYLVAAPTLTVAVKWADVLDPTAPAGASPAPADIVDLTDALTLAALPTAYLLEIEITAANRVVVHVPRAEVGQGITTAIGVIVAEELDARLERRRRRPRRRPARAPLQPAHRRLELGPRAVRADADRRRRGPGPARHRRRRSGGACRPDRSSTRNTPVVAPDGRTRHVRLALGGRGRGDRARGRPRTPKDPSQFTLIGKPHRRIDARDIVTGRADYSLDLDVPGAKPTVVARPPTIGGTVASVDDRGGPRDARGARDHPHPHRRRGHRGDLRPGASGPRRAAHHVEPGPERRAVGRADLRPAAVGDAAVRRAAARRAGRSTATFDFAFAPHAPLEVLNCVADVRADRAELWCGVEEPDRRQPEGGRRRRPAGGPGDASRRPGRRVVRPPPVLRPGHRGRPGVEGDRPSGQADVDPQRRHAPRPHAPGQPPQGPRHPPARQRAHLRAPHGDPAGRLLATASARRSPRSGFDSRAAASRPRACSHLTPEGALRLRGRDPAADRRRRSRSRPAAGARSTPGRPRWSTRSWSTRSPARCGQDPVAFRRQKLSVGAGPGRARPGRQRRPVGPDRCRPAPRRASRSTRSTSASSPTSSRSTARDRGDPRVTKGVCAVDVGRAVNPRGLEAQMQGALDRRALDDAAGRAPHRQRRRPRGQLLRLPLRPDGATARRGSRCTVMPPTATSPAAPASSASRPPPPRSPTPTPGPPGRDRHPLPDRRLRSTTVPTFTFTLNGTRHDGRRAPPTMPLLWVLRDLLGVTGPKYGCGVGVCQACTSHLDGAAFNPCTTPVAECAGRTGHDDRGPRRRRHAPPGAAGLDRRGRRAVRLLPARPDHGRRRAARRQPEPDRRRHRRDRERLPLRHLRPHPRRHPPGRAADPERSA